MQRFALILVFAWLTACSHLRPKTSEYTLGYNNSYRNAQEIKDEEMGRYELGLMRLSRSLSEAETQALQNRILLKQWERQIPSSVQRNLYFQHKAFFRNDLERIEYLQIPDYADQVSWLERRNFFQRLSNHSQEVQEAIQQNDILLYMPMNAVRESWGEPDAREISGQEYLGNERWTYKTYRADNEGYQEQERVLFFENGRVVAWQTN